MAETENYTLYLSTLLKSAGLDLAKTRLIRHSLNDVHFSKCYTSGFLREYTSAQSNKGFADKYDYWVVFVSSAGTSARFEKCYKRTGSHPSVWEDYPEGFPYRDDELELNPLHYELEETTIMSDLEQRLIIDWGKGALSWQQSALNEKPVLAIQSTPKMQFYGFEGICLSFRELEDIISDSILYQDWHVALSSVYAIYLIVDTINGKQYVGSAYGNGGLLSRWNCYVKEKHAGNKRMKEALILDPFRFEKFQFSILQILPKTITADEAIRIESLFKNKLKSIEFGMNDN